jgi:hypothetical protein
MLLAVFVVEEAVVTKMHLPLPNENLGWSGAEGE